MDDKTPMLQFKQGLETIHQALLTAINQREIPLFHIAYTVERAGLRPHDAIFIVATKDRKTESLMFTARKFRTPRIASIHLPTPRFRVLVSRCSGGRE